MRSIKNPKKKVLFIKILGFWAKKQSRDDIAFLYVAHFGIN